MEIIREESSSLLYGSLKLTLFIYLHQIWLYHTFVVSLHQN